MALQMTSIQDISNHFFEAPGVLKAMVMVSTVDAPPELHPSYREALEAEKVE